MDYPNRIAVQINMYPMDYRHVEQLLEHQIRVWGPMVDHIVVTVDTHRSRSGRYRGSNFDQYMTDLRALLARFGERYPQLRTVLVDYSPAARKEVAQAFFGLDDIPVKAWDGGPFYAYFFGLLHADARYVVHFDGDMLFGGGSSTWVEEALALFAARPDTLFVGPFPGPARSDGAVRGHSGEHAPVDVAGGPAYRFKEVSTRIFMIDLQRLRDTLGVLPLLPPRFLKRCKSRLLGNPPDAREAEVILGDVLKANHLWRIDFLGQAPGMWSLHPPYRSEAFYQRLPELIATVERGDVPEAQRGDYDMNDSMIDWSEARARGRRHKRLWRLFKDRVGVS
jgi:hypothetical protein